MAEDRKRPARNRTRQHGEGRSRAQGAAFCRNRMQRVRVVGRRRPLAVVADESAADFNPRSSRSSGRCSSRNPRPFVLDPRQHHAAAPVHPGGCQRSRPGASFRAAVRVSRPPQQQHRHAPAAGRTCRTEPSRWRHDRLLAEWRGNRRSHAGDCRSLIRASSAPLFQRR